MRLAEREIVLSTIGRFWPDHLDKVERLREGIGLRAAFGVAKPIVVYNKEVAELYTKMITEMESTIVFQVLNAQIKRKK